MENYLVKPNCFACNLNANLVKGVGNPNSPDIMVISEYPNQDEVLRKDNIYGFPNKILTQLLEGYGFTDWYFTNTVMCKPAKITPDEKAVSCCNGRLKSEIEVVRPKRILMLGHMTCKALIGKSLDEVLNNYFLYNDIPSICCYSQYLLSSSPDLYRDLNYAVWKLTNEYKPFKFNPEYVLDTEETIIEWFNSIPDGSVISIDYETVHTEPREGLLYLLGFNLRDGIVHQVFRTELSDSFNLELQKLIDRECKFIAFQADMEWKWTNHVFEVELPIADDPINLHYLVDERTGGDDDNRIKAKGVHKLKTIVPREYNTPDWSIDVSDVRKVSELVLFDYLAKDVCANWLALDAVNSMVDSPKLETVYRHIMLPSIPVLARMSQNGIPVDVNWLVKLQETMEAEVDNLATDFQVQCGKEIKASSPKQVADFFFKECGYKDVQRGSVDKEARVKLKTLYPDDPIIAAYCDYKDKAGVLTSGINRMVKQVRGNKIYTKFNMTLTATGRLSSGGDEENTNLQNIPRLKEARGCFINDDPDYVLVELDYSQLEFRVLAYYANDTNLCDFINSGRDIHMETASLFFGVPLSDLTKKDPRRQIAKDTVFGYQYLEGEQAVAAKFNITVDEVQKRRNIIDTMFPGYKKQIDAFWKFAVGTPENDYQDANNYIESAFGRRRRFPLIVNDYHREKVKKLAVNAPVQSMGSDIDVLGLIRADAYFERDVYIPLLQVHDSVLFKWKKTEIHRLYEVAGIFEYQPFDSPVKFEVEVSVGDRWGYLEPFEIDHGRKDQFIEDYKKAHPFRII